MSSGISNLGLGWDPQRIDSSVVKTPDYAGQISAAAAPYQAQAASLQAPQSPQDLLNSLIQQRAQEQFKYYNTPAAGYVPDGTLTLDTITKQLMSQVPTYVQGQGNGWGLDGLLGAGAQQYRDYVGNQAGSMNGFAGYGSQGSYQPQQAEYQQQQAQIAQQQAAAVAKAKAEADAAASNQATQQQAYNQQTGGGFSGGILNGSYSQPFSNTITGTANTGGFAGAPSTAAPSTGLAPTGPAANGTGAAPAGAPASSNAWGGPFSNKNPWSLG